MEATKGADPAFVAQVARVVEPYLAAAGHLGTAIQDDVDLREVGITSLQLVEIVLEVDATFRLSLEESEITPENFRSIAAIARLVASRTRTCDAPGRQVTSS